MSPPLTLQDERILDAHAGDELGSEFFDGRIWIVRWIDHGRRGHTAPTYRYSLFVNGVAECIGAFSERDAVRHARDNRAFIRQRDGVVSSPAVSSHESEETP